MGACAAGAMRHPGRVVGTRRRGCELRATVTGAAAVGFVRIGLDRAPAHLGRVVGVAGSWVWTHPDGRVAHGRRAGEWQQALDRSHSDGLGQRDGDFARHHQRCPTARPLDQDALGDLVEGPGNAGPALARRQEAAVGGPRRRGEAAPRTGRPAGGERGVEQAADPQRIESGRIGVADTARGGQRGLGRQADDLERAGLGDDDAVGVEPLVAQTLVVCSCQRFGDLADEEPCLLRRQRPVTQDRAQAPTGDPLAYDVGDTVVAQCVEHAQEPDVGSGGGPSRGLQQVLRAGVIGSEYVNDDRARQDFVDRTPGLRHPTIARGLGQKLCDPVAAGERHARVDISRMHGPPARWGTQSVPCWLACAYMLMPVARRRWNGERWLVGLATATAGTACRQGRGAR